MTSPATSLVIDCGTGETSVVPLPAGQAAQIAADAAAAVQAAANLEAKRQALLATVQAHAATDAPYAALAQLVGVLPIA